MPYRSLGDNFIGRTSSLWQIHHALHHSQTVIVQGVVAVAGTGGLGKTQTAIEYAHRFGAGYPGGVYWIDSDRGIPTLISQLSEAAEIDIDTKAAEARQLAHLWAGVNKLPPSLLILDNFPEKIALRPYLPTTGPIHTLITTRRQDVTAYPNIRLNLLLGEPGIALLNSADRKLPPQDAAKLVHRLGGLPLALELTKSFLNYRPSVTIPQLLAEMDQTGEMAVLSQFKDTYLDELPSGHELDIAKTFQLSWTLASPPAQNVPRIMADLAPVGVPRDLLHKVLALPEPSGLQDPLEESISELARLSLVELDTNRNPLLHRLIHAFARYRNQADAVSYFETTAQAVREQMLAVYDNPGAAVLRSLDLLLPHAEALLEDDRLALDEGVNLLSAVGSHQLLMARFSQAFSFSAAAVDKAERGLPLGSPTTATTQANLAMVLNDLGDLDGARALLTKALASDEKSFPPGHPSIATGQSNLAMVLQDLGDLARPPSF